MVPALAVAAALQAESPGTRIVFAGGERAEQELVPAAGYELRTLSVQGLHRTKPWLALRAALKAVFAVGASWRLLGELRPAAVLGGGGYVAGPVGLAAVLRRVPLVLSEADSHLGLTNRVLARAARRVCLAFPIDGRSGARYRVTGRPVPARDGDRAAARARFGLGADEQLLLVFGGSLGARSINEAAFAAFAAQAPCRVLHVSGQRDHGDLAARDHGPHYDLQPYLGDFGDALAAATLTVARSGGSVFEIAAAGLPAILVPYPSAAGDHQAGNAAWMERAGAAVVVPDAELSGPGLAELAGALLADPERLAAMGAAASSLARPDAAREIAGEVLAAARETDG